MAPACSSPGSVTEVVAAWVWKLNPVKWTVTASSLTLETQNIVSSFL